jgi:hypothetical protein
VGKKRREKQIENKNKEEKEEVTVSSGHPVLVIEN